MKKIILAVILVAAVGGITYYLFQDKSQTGLTDFKQEQIIGKWKMDSLEYKKDSASLIIGIRGIIDSNLMKYNYDFRKGGIVIKSLKDNVQKDTTNYEWTKDKHLVWKDPDDQKGDSLIVDLLSKDSLVLKSKDSSVFYFKKVK